jgi:hypothetical protein
MKGEILMLKKTMTYTDFDGNQRTEDFYFNLTKAELTEMEFSTNAGFVKTIEKIIATQDQKQLIEIFKDIVLKAYGEKSLDGRRFVKTQEVKDNFAQTQAYSDLFMELATDANAASEFFNSIVPQELLEESKKVDKANS